MICLYVAYVYSNSRDNAIHPTLISKIIVKADIPDILEIKKIDNGKILIVVKTVMGAIILWRILLSLRAFILAF